MGAFLRAVWNGPFYIGELAQPVSVGDVLMKVLETAWRAAVIVIVGVGAAVAWLVYRDHKARSEQAALRDQVVISAIMDVKTCGSTRPISVLIHNRSAERLASVSYSVFITDPKSGDDVAPSHFRYLTTKRGLLEGYSIRTCLTPFWTDYGAASEMDSLDPAMTVSAVVNSVTAG